MAAALLLCLSEDLNNTLTRVPHTHVCLLLNSSVMHDVMIFWAKDKNMLIRSLLFEMCVKLQTADFPPTGQQTRGMQGNTSSMTQQQYVAIFEWNKALSTLSAISALCKRTFVKVCP